MKLALKGLVLLFKAIVPVLTQQNLTFYLRKAENFALPSMHYMC